MPRYPRLKIDTDRLAALILMPRPILINRSFVSHDTLADHEGAACDKTPFNKSSHASN